jgi:hypothetical protein
MSTEEDLLRIALALHLGFVTEEQVRACRNLQAERKGSRLADLLVERGDLKPPEATALEAMHSVKGKSSETIPRGFSPLFPSMRTSNGSCVPSSPKNLLSGGPWRNRWRRRKVPRRVRSPPTTPRRTCGSSRRD